VNEQETKSVVTVDSIERCDGARGLFLFLFAFDWCCGVGLKSGMAREKGVTFLSLEHASYVLGVCRLKRSGVNCMSLCCFALCLPNKKVAL
jgi:hypothetical protein